MQITTGDFPFRFGLSAESLAGEIEPQLPVLRKFRTRKEYQDWFQTARLSCEMETFKLALQLNGLRYPDLWDVPQPQQERGLPLSWDGMDYNPAEEKWEREMIDRGEM